jgi:hypothetical protein
LDLRDVRKAFRAQMALLGEVVQLIQDDRVQGENRQLDPGSSTEPYITERLSILAENQVAFGVIQVEGRAEYRICVPIHSGTQTLDELGQRLASAFQPPRTVPGDLVNVSVYRVERGQPGPVGTSPTSSAVLSYALPVNIYWRAFVPTSPSIPVL